jgi:proteasome lid subunit RPN8/RPN11
MAIKLSKEIDGQIRAHGEQEFPYECCGLMLGTVDGDDRTVAELYTLTNVHEDGHERRFRIDPKEQMLAEKGARERGLKMLGVYHSHPDHPARPSEYDREWAWPWYSYIIVSVEKGKSALMTSWQLKEDGSAYDEEAIEIVD